MRADKHKRNRLGVLWSRAESALEYLWTLNISACLSRSRAKLLPREGARHPILVEPASSKGPHAFWRVGAGVRKPGQLGEVLQPGAACAILARRTAVVDRARKSVEGIARSLKWGGV